LLKSHTAKVVVEPRGTRREYELISLLRQAGKGFRRLTIAAGTPLDGVTIREINSRANHDVAIITARKPGGWQLTPDGDTTLTAGEELYAIGSPSALDAFEGVVA
jgi:Trk K+ transport system NAD-binding subunit